MVDVMTEKQFDKIIPMIRMILDGCKDLEEAKKKVERLMENGKDKEEQQRKGAALAAAPCMERIMFCRPAGGRGMKQTNKGIWGHGRKPKNTYKQRSKKPLQ